MANAEVENLGSFIKSNRDRFQAGLIGGDTELMVSNIRATGRISKASKAYEEARSVQANLRRTYLQPLLDGPLGKLAGEKTTQQAIEALFQQSASGFRK